jgi:hypothetical protein
MVKTVERLRARQPLTASVLGRMAHVTICLAHKWLSHCNGCNLPVLQIRVTWKNIFKLPRPGAVRVNYYNRTDTHTPWPYAMAIRPRALVLKPRAPIVGYMIWVMVMCAIKRPWVGAKPRPDPSPNIQTCKLTYTQTYTLNKNQLVVQRSGGRAKALCFVEVRGSNPTDSTISFTHQS